MEDKKKSTYKGYTEAKKRCNARWSAKQAQISIRVLPEIKKEIEEHLKMSEESMASFIVRSVKLQISMDLEKKQATHSTAL